MHASAESIFFLFDIISHECMHFCHLRQGWSKGREWTANVLLGIGAILWSVPVASIQALATADQIGEYCFVVQP